MKLKYLSVQLFALFFLSCNAQEYDSQINKEFRNQLKDICIQYEVPAIAAAVVKAESIEKIAVYGIKKLGTEDSVGINSKFHVGSCGKSFTGVIANALVNENLLSWNDTPTDIFPELKEIIHDDYQEITFLDLMTHRAGISAYSYWHEKELIPVFTGSEAYKREKTAYWQLEQPATSVVGEFSYSNIGYVIAASMMEKVTGKSWEQLVEEYVFNPLEIKSFGFGRPALNDSTQPWGHWQQWQGQTEQQSVAPNEYTLQSIERPAGDVHLSIVDFAKYAQFHLKGLQGKSDLYDKNFFIDLHTIRNEYALGWGENYRYGERCSIHFGSEATFFATIVVFHETDLAIVIVSNSATQEAKRGVNTLLKDLY